MRPLPFILFCFLVLIVQPASAQERTPWIGPWENPEQFFGPDVRVIGVRLSNSESISIENRLALTPDGRRYPFPPELNSGEDYQLDSVGIIGNRMYLEGIRLYGEDTTPYRWSLNTVTGEWTQLDQWPEQIETPCGLQPWPQSGFHWLQWVQITGRNLQQHACNPTSGLITAPFPNGYSNWKLMPTSDDFMDYLFISGKSLADQTLALFALEVATNRFIEVSAGWLTRSIIQYNYVAHLGPPNLFQAGVELQERAAEDPLRQMAIFDLSGELLALVPGDFRYRENPARLEYWRSSDNNGEPATDCIISWFDLTTKAWRSVHVNLSCHWDYAGDRLSLQGAPYFRVVDEAATRASLVVVDFDTMDIRSLYEGEIEAIVWLSEDLHYAALILDSSGHIDNPLSNVTDMSPLYSGAQFKLIDLVDDRVLYQTPALDCQWMYDEWCPHVYNVTDNLLGMRNAIGAAQTDLFSLTEERMVSRDIPGRLSDPFHDDWAYLAGPFVSEVGGFDRLDLYNLGSRQVIGLVNLTTEAAWLIDYRYLGDGEFEISVGYDWQFYFEPEPVFDVAVYRVRVDAPGL